MVRHHVKRLDEIGRRSSFVLHFLPRRLVGDDFTQVFRCTNRVVSHDTDHRVGNPLIVAVSLQPPLGRFHRRDMRFIALAAHRQPHERRLVFVDGERGFQVVPVLVAGAIVAGLTLGVLVRLQRFIVGLVRRPHLAAALGRALLLDRGIVIRLRLVNLPLHRVEHVVMLRTLALHRVGVNVGEVLLDSVGVCFLAAGVCVIADLRFIPHTRFWHTRNRADNFYTPPKYQIPVICQFHFGIRVNIANIANVFGRKLRTIPIVATNQNLMRATFWRNSRCNNVCWRTATPIEQEMNIWHTPRVFIYPSFLSLVNHFRSSFKNVSAISYVSLLGNEFSIRIR